MVSSHQVVSQESLTRRIIMSFWFVVLLALSFYNGYRASQNPESLGGIAWFFITFIGGLLAWPLAVLAAVYVWIKL